MGAAKEGVKPSAWLLLDSERFSRGRATLAYNTSGHKTLKLFAAPRSPQKKARPVAFTDACGEKDATLVDAGFRGCQCLL